jgi:L-2-hydroxyglutarate oxidase LhgO
MDHVNCIVVGAGVIGLALARALAQAGREVLILEANERFGAETSSRNNEVIHAGFLYPAGSLKAQLCRAGASALYRYCADRGVVHRRIGKLMIATSETEQEMLRQFAAAAPRHGVDDLVCLDAGEARGLEPNLHCLAALRSPSTGIVDAHGLMLALLGDAEAAGATIAYRTGVTGGHHAGDRIVLETTGAGGTSHALSCDILINAAGLGARDVAAHFVGRLPDLPEIVFAKGNFFSYSGSRPFETLVVPLGDTLRGGGAFTIDTGGQGKFGPDLEIASAVNYTVDPARLGQFIASIRRFFPDVDASRLAPNFAGIRPQVRVPSDWLVLSPSEHGLPGTFHLLGFDTPGMTACLAIADHVVRQVIAEEKRTCRLTASAE